MKCPICKDVTLVMSERQRVEIDFCPECRGVWLDRGELDKIIELSMQTTTEELRRETRGSQDNERHRGDEQRDPAQARHFAPVDLARIRLVVEAKPLAQPHYPRR